MALSFAVVGGGWYGCHIATAFRSLGFDVTIFEQQSRLMHLASGNNQFRLHMGFHYPRHYGTRMQSRDGFSRFIERYPSLSRPIAQNIYAVPRGDSLIDFITYKLIMTSSGIEFTEISDIPEMLENIDGCILTSERVLLLDVARKYFSEKLRPCLNLDYKVEKIEESDSGVFVDGQRFDFLIDATWGHLTRPPIELYYEPTMLLYYEAKEAFPAVTMVDGPLCSVYPTEDPNIYTLSSVIHTPLGQYHSSQEARNVSDSLTRGTVQDKVAGMEAQISKYVPGFKDVFKFLGPQLSLKTKPVGSFDDRSCYVYKRGRTFSVMSGKIDTIFFATERILSMIELGAEEMPSVESGGLRGEIAGLENFL